MSDINKFDPDIFISCTDIDDRKHWITSFEKELHTHINRLLGRKVTIWRDTTVSKTGELSNKIRKKLNNTAVLLCIVSENWIRPNLSRPDVAEFQRCAIAKGRAPSVILVHKRAIIYRDDLLPEWRVEYRFFGREREFSPSDEEFHATIAALASKIALVLSSKTILAEGLGEPSGTFDIIFSPELSNYEIRKSFAALADYYRSCGGIGLAIEQELEEVPAQESVNV